MGTRSTIALEFADGTVEQVYCHWDGYLSHNGQILAEHYSDPFVLQKLIDLGGLSSLGKVIGEAHPFSPHTSALDKLAYEAAKEAGYCTFYARDRGEKLVVHKFVDFDDYLAHHSYEEFEYILRNVDGKAVWFVDCGACGYVALETALINEKESA
jgi:hypothetical protein